MDNSYHFCQLFMCMVLVSILNGRTAWSIKRRGDFVGCFTNITHTQVSLSGSQSVDECVDRCTVLLAHFASLGDDGTTTSCRCFRFTGDGIEFGTAVPLSRCNSTCPANQLESCGGYNASAVYTTTNRTCSDPGAPVNGSRIGNDFVIGSDVAYNCSTGLVADGPNVARCWWLDSITLEIGWSSPAPACVDPFSLVTTETSTETDTIPPQRMVSSTIGPPISIISNIGIIIGILLVVIILNIVVVSVMVFMWKKRQRRRANFSRNSSPSNLPLSNSKAQLTQITPKKEEKHENEVEDEDYLVPDAKVVALAKGSGQGQTLERVENRPRLPAPSSVKASLTPDESLYQNSISIALSRSKENLHKETKGKPVSKEPAYQNRTVVTRQDRAKATEGAVGKPPTARTSSLPLDADGIYQNAQMGVRMSSPRMPLTARLRDERRASHDSSGTASQRSSLNYRDSADYVTPNATIEQEVYENAGLVRQRQGPRRPPGQPVENAAAVDSGDSDGVYLDLI